MKLFKKIDLKALGLSLLAVCLVFFGAALVFNLAAPPVYAVASAWNLVKDGGNNLNFLWSTNASSAMSITSGGFVGIGTTAPGANLDVKGPLSAGTASLLLRNGDGATGTSSRTQIRFGYADTDQYQNYIVTRHSGGTTANNAIDFYTGNGAAAGVFPTNAVLGLSINGGNVGVGTTSPGYKLDIKTSSAAGLRLQRASGGTDTELVFSNETPVDNWFFHANGSSPEQMFIYPAGSSQNLILQTNEAGTALGRVGIGTTVPNYLLHVGAGADAFSPGGTGALVSNAGATNLAIRDSTSDVELLNYVYSGGGLIGTYTNHNLSIRTNNTDKMTILAGGNVGIGTTAPVGKLHITNGEDGLVFYNPGNDLFGLQTSLNNQPITGAYGGDANILVLQQYAGRVGIGTTAPSAKFHVAGGAAGTARIDGGIGINGYGPQSGLGGCTASFGLCVGGSSGGQSIWNNLSDVRLKKNIITISDPIKKVMSLRGVYFDFQDLDGIYKTLPKGRQVGFIAQEVEPVLPEIVTTGTDGIKSLGTSSITALLTEAIKEQQKQIEAEKLINSRQQEEINLLKLEIEQLKNK